MKIFVVGSGKLANAIIDAQLSIQSCDVIKWDSKYTHLPEKAIVIHAGSGRQLNECLDFCRKTKSILIELSTGLETDTLLPDFPMILCPNTSVLLLKTLHMLNVSGQRFKDYDISITESHQASKKTEPGTAFAFARSLSFPIEKIVSVRNPEIQLRDIGIPHEFLDKHAYHKIVIKDGTDEITIETKVLGHNTYANGVKAIITAVLKHNLENRRYTVLDLIEKNML